ncbi:MAG: cob(I)yrinic acid a,c-diamide adenosyltransferase [Parvularculales bacterium]
MVTLNKIYTKTGDKGDTALGDGQRRPKHDRRVEAYGAVDEANSAIGMVRLHTANDETLDSLLARIQNDLFDLGADLCRPAPPDNDGESTDKALRITPVQVTRLEEEIDRLNADLNPLRSFVLPGGTPAAAHFHLARALTRRAERRITALATHEPVGEPAVAYINRLSDLLFVAARHANNKGADDVLWTPGANST